MYHTALYHWIEFIVLLQVHILNETRGSILEVVVSRMKTRGKHVRFLLVSATVPNIDDVAVWIGNGSSSNDGPATVYSVRTVDDEKC